jgi:hypothetical protein
MEHTPGPWKFIEDDGIFYVEAGNGHRYADGDMEGACGECLANARLIAAAPEMLEALKDARDFIEKYCKATNHEPTQIPTYNLVCSCIARAEAQP